MIWNSSLWDGKGCQKMESCSKLPYVQMQAEKMTATIIQIRFVQKYVS